MSEQLYNWKRYAEERLRLIEAQLQAQRDPRPTPPTGEQAESAIECAINAAYTVHDFTREDRDAARAELRTLRAKAALADAMWNHLDIVNAPLDAYERSWAAAYEEIK